MLTSSQPSQTSVRRDAWVEIDLGAIEHNLSEIRSWLKPGTLLMAVVKGDAYGHGAVDLTQVLQASGVEAFGVASVDEGCQLQSAGAKVPVLVLGPCPIWAIRTALEADLSLTISSISQIGDIAAEAKSLGKQARVHLKVDTGMHRLGLATGDVKEAVELISKLSELKLVGLYSHLAEASDSQSTAKQNKLFQAVVEDLIACEKLPELVHLASGEAARKHADTHYDMVRVGLYIYGLEPKTVSEVVRPAMSVRGRINQLKEIEAGESIGYGFTWTAKRKTRLASLPIGYADGVDRKLSNKISGLLFGNVVPQVGLISMDQMLFDVTDVGEVCVGDVITLIGSEDGAGRQLYLADWAKMLDTITYELACRLRIRLPRMYTRQKWQSNPNQTK